MTLQQEYRERFQEGKIEGRKEGQIEGMIKILDQKLHMTIPEIAKELSLPEEEVQKIINRL